MVGSKNGDGYTKDGYTKDGYTKDGYTKDGYTRDGYTEGYKKKRVHGRFSLTIGGRCTCRFGQDEQVGGLVGIHFDRPQIAVGGRFVNVDGGAVREDIEELPVGR